MTHYIVLKRWSNPLVDSPADGTWAIIGHAEASGPQQARKGIDPSDGEYLVVPVRNATFISGTTEQPAPRPVSVEVAADTYLDVQTSIDEAVADESAADGEPEPAPVAA